MLQKCVIIGLALLLIGGLATAWVHKQTQAERAKASADGTNYSLGPEEYLDKYGRWYQLSPEQQNQLVLELDRDRQDKTSEQLALEQKARLRADLDKLAAGQMEPGDIADILYGVGWQDEVERSKKLKEKMEIAQITSIVCLSIGSVLFAVCILVWVLRSFVRFLRERQRSFREEEESPPNAELMDVQLHDPVEAIPIPEEQPRQGRRRLAASDKPAESLSGSVTAKTPAVSDEFLSPLVAARARMNRSPAGLEAPAEDGGVAVLLADEPSQQKEWSADMQWSVEGGLAVVARETPKEPQSAVKTRLSSPSVQESTDVVENPLKEQADDLQKQIAEFKEMAQTVVQQATREQSEPLGNTLKELAQQVSAIREYAACQQGRVEKLQDGYDWGIVRTFCLRVIRCIDNIENRIDNPPKDCPDLIYLEEVRDELLFAMESSGVEQFRPEINSEYHGQEKLAEAIKEKQPAKQPEQAGRIALVIRPGYRYMIDDENYKVVRTAQVKLFG